MKLNENGIAKLYQAKKYFVKKIWGLMCLCEFLCERVYSFTFKLLNQSCESIDDTCCVEAANEQS